MNERRKKKYVEWIMLNLILPLAPVVIKCAISVLGQDGILKASIIDSVELIYYNLFICIIFLNIVDRKKKIKLVEVFLSYVFKGICIVDLIMIILIYLEMQSIGVGIMAVVLTIIIPVFVAIYYYSEEVIGEERNDK